MAGNTLPHVDNISVYEHLPLPINDHSIRKIRVLSLHASRDFDAELLCDLKYFLLGSNDRSNPADSDSRTQGYSALSYAWGNPIFSHELICQFGPIKITANVDLALRHLRLSAEPRVLWIDAICIDQSNDMERNHQVDIMADIYREANDVQVWLGDESEQNDAAAIFSLLDESGNNLALASSYHLKDISTHNLVTKSTRVTIQDFLAEQTGKLLLQAFFDRPYFSRRWVIQELAFGRRTIFHCGSLTIQPKELRNLAMMLRNTATNVCKEETIDAISAILISAVGSWRGRALGPLECLMQYLRFKCSDDRDKIFALRAVIETRARCNPQSILRGVGYHSSVTSVYTEFARLHLAWVHREHDETYDRMLHPFTDLSSAYFSPRFDYEYQYFHDFEDLRLLSVAGSMPCQEPNGGDELVDFPSWVPDWRVFPRYQPFRFKNKIYGREGSSKGIPARLLEAHASQQCLTARAILYDIVENTHCNVNSFRAALDLFNNGKTLSRLPRNNHSLIKSFRRRLGRFSKEVLQPSPPRFQFDSVLNSDQHFHLAVTLVANGDCICKHFLEKCYASLGDRYQPCIPEIDQFEDAAVLNAATGRLETKDILTPEQYEALLLETMRSRCLFTTEKGHIGIGPDNARKGDLVAIISRGYTPFILRPTSDSEIDHNLHRGSFVKIPEDITFKLIGDAYIHAIMNGEVAEELGPVLNEAFRKILIV